MTYEQEQRLLAACDHDPFYQELLCRCGELEPDYFRIKNRLSEEDQEKLERYISVCEELEYRRSFLAYALGTQDGVRNGTAQFVNAPFKNRHS